MSNPIRGVQCSDTKRVLQAALDNGWTFAGWSGTTHGAIEWPATGERVTFGTTPSDRNGWKKIASQIHRISGVEVWRRGNKKPSRKAPQLTGYDPSAARRESLAREQRHHAELMRQARIRDAYELVAELAYAARNACPAARTSTRARGYYDQLRHQYAVALAAYQELVRRSA